MDLADIGTQDPRLFREMTTIRRPRRISTIRTS